MSTLQFQWGATLRRLRMELGLSLVDLGRLADVEPSHLNRAELGQANFSDERRMRIASALGVQVSEIWEYPEVDAP